jgi:hypothetical protein
MLRYGRFLVSLETFADGVLVTVSDGEGMVCQVADRDARCAVLAALEAAEAPPVDEAA